MSPDARCWIRKLNDALRQQHEGGRVALSAGVAGLAPDVVAQIVAAVRRFDDFDADNDPYGEHDFGSLRAGGQSILWKIDYFDRTLRAHSPDPADPHVTKRVLLVMLAAEY